MADNDNAELENKKAELRKFLKDTESLEKLEMLADKENIFSILSLERMEIRHSNFIAWLLNPSGNHHLGDIFLKKLLYEYAESSGTDKTIDIFDIDKMDLSDSIVYRELNRFDIAVESRNSDFVLVIENKIDSKEREKQTLNYREKTEKKYADVKNKFFVYLTIEGEDAEDDQWVCMSHFDVLKIIKSLVNRLPEGSRSRIYVEDYIETMGKVIGMGESELETICADIYSKHKKAIDILVANIPDDLSKRAGYFKTLIKETNGLEPRDSNNTFIRFTTEAIIEKFGLSGTDEWLKTQDVLLFEIVNNRNGKIRFTLTLGPCADGEYRKAIFDHIKPLLTTRTINNVKDYTRLYSEFFNYDEDKGDDYEKLKKQFDKFVTETIPKKIMPAINSFPGYDKKSS